MHLLPPLAVLQAPLRLMRCAHTVPTLWGGGGGWGASTEVQLLSCVCFLPFPHLRARVVGGLRRTADGKIDYKEDFFTRPSYLTVSGQLQVGAGVFLFGTA